MTEAQQRLCDLLRPFQDGTDPAAGQPDTWLTEGTHDEFPPTVRAVVEVAEEALITPLSRPDYAAMREVEQATGVRIGPGEQDSFGWLSGVIRTQGGTFVYG